MAWQFGLVLCSKYLNRYLKLTLTRTLKGELRPKISLLHMKVLPLIKAKSNVFLWYVQCCSCTRRSKTKILTTRALPSWIVFDVVTSHRQTRHLEYGLWSLISMFLRLLISCKARKIVWESQVIDPSSITQSETLWVWRCDVQRQTESKMAAP